LWNGDGFRFEALLVFWNGYALRFKALLVLWNGGRRDALRGPIAPPPRLGNRPSREGRQAGSGKHEP
jgi:hypothetical protein